MRTASINDHELYLRGMLRDCVLQSRGVLMVDGKATWPCLSDGSGIADRCAHDRCRPNLDTRPYPYQPKLVPLAGDR